MAQVNGMIKYDRMLHKTIKGYDQKRMYCFLKELYHSGFEDGNKAVQGIDIEQVKKAVSETKGIGPVKMAAIIKSIDKLFEVGGKPDESVF